jgi:hypothetical protein
MVEGFEQFALLAAVSELPAVRVHRVPGMGPPVLNDTIELARAKLNDPDVVRWALRRYEQAQVRGPQYCRPMEEAWFHDLALRHPGPCRTTLR